MITTAHAHKSGVIFHLFPRAFKQKKIQALRPKMTKIALRGGGGPALIPSKSRFMAGHFILPMRTLLPFDLILREVEHSRPSGFCVFLLNLNAMTMDIHTFSYSTRGLVVIQLLVVWEDFSANVAPKIV